MTTHVLAPRHDDTREWLATNGLGDFAMGTLSRLHTRKYHGLLSVRGLSGHPTHLLADVAETLVCGEEKFELGNFPYDQGVIHPHGYRHLQDVHCGDSPSWTYACGRCHVRRTVELAPGHHVVRITWEVRGHEPGDELILSPYFTVRSVHDCRRENAFLLGTPHAEHELCVLQLYPDQPEILLRITPHTALEAAGHWNQRVLYVEELRRGYEAHEDLFCPGAFKLRLPSDGKVVLEIGLLADVRDVVGGEPRAEHREVGMTEKLASAAEQFVYENAAREPGMIAGFPWFGEWARDTLISLDGLLLARHQFNRAAAILERYAGLRQSGLLPNIVGVQRIDHAGVAPDASLMFVRALQQMAAASGFAAIERWLPAAYEIMEALAAQSVAGVGITPDGLLAAERAGEALTWMDVKINGRPLTPRAPYAVELNALYYNALCFTLEAAARQGRGAFVERFEPLREKFAPMFAQKFWSDERGFFADSHNGHSADFSLRPNQLFAISLPFSAASSAQAKSVLAKVREKLLTPFGLRTLAHDEPGYRGRCEGDQTQRDLAYHQGTVWPWLLIPYMDAVAKHEGAERAAEEARRFLGNFERHLEEACVGQVSEIFDGDDPHTPRGAPAQAWSVAALLAIGRHLQMPAVEAPKRRRSTSVKAATTTRAKRKSATQGRSKAVRE